MPVMHRADDAGNDGGGSDSLSVSDKHRPLFFHAYRRSFGYTIPHLDAEPDANADAQTDADTQTDANANLEPGGKAGNH